eukprot:CAMPEP_0181501266 /NCGR_PEP_ID=MMETSP1110-20121109/55697_1 /TAXON_ID=174948 /ORGANISM="Symbiodinium sp., Strain CCMP421" /LENGTH=166 /DNA_ID=CAMNT_0023629701 /DNA_START=769 /DNA_END=1270 /DNA_ORIENTATION=-
MKTARFGMYRLAPPESMQDCRLRAFRRALQSPQACQQLRSTPEPQGAGLKLFQPREAAPMHVAAQVHGGLPAAVVAVLDGLWEGGPQQHRNGKWRVTPGGLVQRQPACLGSLRFKKAEFGEAAKAAARLRAELSRTAARIGQRRQRCRPPSSTAQGHSASPSGRCG